METDSLRAAGAMVTTAMEQADDHAHTSGRIKAEMARLKRMTEAERIDWIIFQSRASAALHRDTAKYFGELLMWMRQHGKKQFETVGGTVYTRALAENEYRRARHYHRRVCGQLGHWLAERDRHRAGPLVLPPAANCDAPNSSSRESAA